MCKERRDPTEELGASGKPSTWLPLEELAELTSSPGVVENPPSPSI